LYDNTFYYLKNDVGLVSHDVFTGEEKILVFGVATIPQYPFDQSQEVYMNDFYFADNKIFALMGPFCNEYMAKCNNELVTFDLNGSNKTVLASGITDRNIVGYDKAEQKLVMRYTDGDAGCAWGQYNEYDFETKKISLIGDASGCYEADGDAPEGLAFGNQVRQIFEKQSSKTYSVYVNSGILSIGTTTRDKNLASKEQFRVITDSLATLGD
jgi:hypothetical protein